MYTLGTICSINNLQLLAISAYDFSQVKNFIFSFKESELSATLFWGSGALPLNKTKGYLNASTAVLPQQLITRWVTHTAQTCQTKARFTS